MRDQDVQTAAAAVAAATAMAAATTPAAAAAVAVAVAAAAAQPLTVVLSSRRRQGANISYRACEDPMHCCSPVPDPEFLVNTVYSLWARVTCDSRDGQIQYTDIVQVSTPWLIVVKK